MSTPAKTAAPVPVDFFCVGGDKCGSTWLSEMLRQHPQLNVADNKEPHFFTDKWNWHRGWDWYGRNWSREGGVRGEFSTSYIHCRFALERIAAHYPNAKIIVLLRHPLQRSISQLKHLLRSPENRALARGGTAEEYAEFLVKHRMVIRCSKFSFWFDVMAERIPPERVKVFYFEQIRDEPERVIAEAFALLGVDAEFRPTQPDAVRNRGFVPKSYWLEAVRERTFRFLEKYELYGAIHWVKRSGLPGLLRRANSGTTDESNMRQALLASVPEFIDDLERLRDNPLIPDSRYLDQWARELRETAARQ